MGLFGGLFGPGINEHMEQARATAGSIVVDVRTPGEFAQGHVKGAINVPVDRIDAISSKVKNPDAPLYLYCASGARSSSAARYLERSGYTNVTNMGGIGGYRGEVAKGAK